MPQIKSCFGDWKTVSESVAYDYAVTFIDGGCLVSKIGNHVKGISIDSILQKHKRTVSVDSKESLAGALDEVKQKYAKKPGHTAADCVVEIETLARNIFRLDETVRTKLPHVKDWIGECADEIKSYANKFEKA